MVAQEVPVKSTQPRWLSSEPSTRPSAACARFLSPARTRVKAISCHCIAFLAQITSRFLADVRCHSSTSELGVPGGALLPIVFRPTSKFRIPSHPQFLQEFTPASTSITPEPILSISTSTYFPHPSLSPPLPSLRPFPLPPSCSTLHLPQPCTLLIPSPHIIASPWSFSGVNPQVSVPCLSLKAHSALSRPWLVGIVRCGGVPAPGHFDKHWPPNPHIPKILKRCWRKFWFTHRLAYHPPIWTLPVDQVGT